MTKSYYFKSLLLSSAALSVLFVSCGSDGGEEEILTVSPTSVIMHYDESQQLTASGQIDFWTSDNEFVATVSPSGLVSGNHVGVTSIKAAKGTKSVFSTVEIKPRYNVFDTPVTDFGATKATIKSREKHTFSSERDNALLYIFSEGTHPCLASYAFQNNKLFAIYLYLKAGDYQAAGLHLLERYQPATLYDDAYFFMNGLTSASSNMMIMLETTTFSGSTMTCVAYGKWPMESSSSAKDTRSFFPETALPLNELFQ